MAATTWTQVGVQAITLYPYNGAVGPYNSTNAINVYGIMSADIGITVDTVEGKAGDSVYTQFTAEVGREITVKMQSFKIGIDAFNLLWGGRMSISAAGTASESQYLTPNLTDRSPEVRAVIESTVGDGAMTMVCARARAKGSFSLSMKAREIIMPEFELSLRWDPTYTALDGQVGGIIDFLWSASGKTSRS
jgi:hypothetical protein